MKPSDITPRSAYLQRRALLAAALPLSATAMPLPATRSTATGAVVMDKLTA